MKHWTETDNAQRVRDTFRNLPPNTWDVTIHATSGPDVFGEIDIADVHSLIAAILAADVDRLV